jgi:hypothetical protein
MGLKKGTTNNRFGRPQGSPNKVTQGLKENIKLLVENNFDRLQSDIESMEPKDRVQTIIKLMEYVIPKQQKNDLSLDLSAKEQINVIFEPYTK